MIKLMNPSHLAEAVKAAESILKDPAFEREIIRVIDFDMSDCTPLKIIRLMKFPYVIFVDTYTPFYRWSKAYAMFNPANPFVISLSTRKLNRSRIKRYNVASLVGSIFHELVHLVDNQYPHYSFGHGKGINANSPTGKENTAPYKMGKMAKEFYLNKF